MRRALAMAAGALALVMWLAPHVAHGQVGMPDPSQMSGVPLPSPDLPTGTLTVRVVRGSLSNNIPNQKVELMVAGARRDATTAASGRAEFASLRPGDRVQASTVVDGQRLESQVITMPAQGGVRVMLVAEDAESWALKGRATAEGRATTEDRAADEPQPGTVTLGGESRFIVERGDEALNVFYVLEIVNTARTPIDTGGPLIFDLPSGAIGATLLQGSTPQATVGGTRVTVTGPFAPGTTPLQIAYELPHRGPRVTIEQRLPAALPQLAAAGETTGGVTLASPQFTASRDMNADGRTFKVGNGPGLPAGGTLALTFDNLPHHPRWPRFTALAIAIGIVGAGLVAAFRRPSRADASPQALLERAREAHLAELAALDARRREGAISAEQHAGERQRVVAALEDIYASLDEQPASAH